MSRSTYLLLRMARWRIGLAVVKLAILGYMIGYLTGPHDAAPGWLGAMLGCAASMLMFLPAMYRNLLAPVTDRQLAFIPRAFILPLALIAAAFQAIGQFVRGMAPSAMAHLWISALPASVWILLIFLLFWRLLRISPAFCGFMGFGGFLGQTGRFFPNIQSWTSLALEWWPAALAACVFIVLESPVQEKHMRSMGMMPGVKNWAAPTPDFLSPSRAHWPTRLLDGVNFLLLASIVAVGCFAVWRMGLESVRQNPMMIFFAFFLIFPVWLGMTAWRQNRASGMGVIGAAVVLIPRATLILEPWKDLIGVKHGAPIRCGHCKGWRFAWQRACPHCESAQSAEKPFIPAEPYGFWRGQRFDPLAMFYRIWAPAYLLVFIVVRNYARWFH